MSETTDAEVKSSSANETTEEQHDDQVLKTSAVKASSPDNETPTNESTSQPAGNDSSETVETTNKSAPETNTDEQETDALEIVLQETSSAETESADKSLSQKSLESPKTATDQSKTEEQELKDDTQIQNEEPTQKSCSDKSNKESRIDHSQEVEEKRPEDESSAANLVESARIETTSTPNFIESAQVETPISPNSDSAAQNLSSTERNTNANDNKKNSSSSAIGNVSIPDLDTEKSAVVSRSSVSPLERLERIASGHHQPSSRSHGAASIAAVAAQLSNSAKVRAAATVVPPPFNPSQDVIPPPGRRRPGVEYGPGYFPPPTKPAAAPVPIQPAPAVQAPLPSYQAHIRSKGPPNYTVMSAAKPPNAAEPSDPTRASDLSADNLRQLLEKHSRPPVPFPPKHNQPQHSPDVEVLSVSSARGPAKVSEEMFTLLFTRPSSPPPYRFQPPPPELGLPVPPGGHPCRECGDIFALRSSLEFHMERSVMEISTFCSICRVKIIFLNRCRFLEHLRKHNEAAGVNLSPDGVFPKLMCISLEGYQLKEAVDRWFNCPAFKRMTDLTELYAYEFGSPDSNLVPEVNSFKQLAAMTAAHSNRPLPILPKHRQNFVKPQVTVCSECKTEKLSAELRAHFVYNLPPGQKQFICDQCTAVYFSPCSFSAHKRSHLPIEQQGPFTCPECGIFVTSGPELAHHIREHRFAPTVLHAWRCQRCSTFYSNFNTLIVHVATAHADTYFKCTRCPTAFASMDAFQEHRVQKHPGGVGEGDVTPDTAPKCPQCDQIFNGKDALAEHLKTHMGGMQSFKVYRCPVCGRLMENKGGLLAHYDRLHQIKMLTGQMSEYVFRMGETADRDAPKRAYPGNADGSAALHAPPQKRPIEQPQNKPVHTNRPVSAVQMTPSGEREGTARIVCPICPNSTMVFVNSYMLRLHLKVKHHKDVSADDLEREWLESQQRAKAAAAEVGAKRGGGLMLECRKAGCAFRASNRAEMAAHVIGTHRSADNSLCLECGLSFISPVSLKRHLISAHQIEDPDDYIRDHPQCLPAESSADLKCSVCGEEFPTHDQLNTHARKHGMMFLQRNSAQPKALV